MTVLGENPGEEIIVTLLNSDPGGATYAWNTGLATVTSAVAAVTSGGAELVTSVSGSTVNLAGLADNEAVYAIATGW